MPDKNPKTIIYHIPVCPFSQRIEIMLAIKGLSELVEFQVIDITKPRPDWLLEKTGGTTALPVLEMTDGTVIKESLVIMQYIEDITPKQPLARTDARERAIENLFVTLADDFTVAGYRMVMNQDKSARSDFAGKLLSSYKKMNEFLERYAPNSLFLFDQFGWAETVFTPMFMRFWFLEYYEDFAVPDTPEYKRVREWQDACLQHPHCQQVSKEEIVKLYYDYAKGAGNGALLEGRTLSSFAFEPDWRNRPWPPKDKYNVSASDEELGLV